MNWPDDADGDVLRRMGEDRFDFAKHHLIEFNVDFDQWPPMAGALAVIKCRYPDAMIHEPMDDDQGYVQFQVHALASYDSVMKVQHEVSALMDDFGGRCESWGVMQDEV